jgi:26S proteasome non-ATPase regulatory subunit 5
MGAFCVQVVTDVAVHSDAGLQGGHANGLLPALIAELHGSDILLQLNALELLTKLALCDHGLQYLQQHGVLTALANKVTAVSEDPLASLTLPGKPDCTFCSKCCVMCEADFAVTSSLAVNSSQLRANGMSMWITVFVAGLIKFFGNVTQSWPKEVFAEYPTIVMALFETFDSPDLVLLGVAMETVGYIGTTVEGKYMLESLGMSHCPLVRPCLCVILCFTSGAGL